MIQILINWVISHPYSDTAFIISVIEIFLRLFPTSKNYSLLDKLHTLLNFILPNLKDKTEIAKTQQQKTVIENLQSKNPASDKFKII